MIFNKEEYFEKTFRNQDFSGEKISSKQFEGCLFIGCNFSDVVFDSCNLVECDFEKCNLSVVKLDRSRVSDVTFRDSKAIGIDWNRVVLPRLLFNSPVKFFNTILSDSSFFGLSFHELVVEGCVAHNVDFREGDFSGSNFKFTDFSGALFSDTNLSRVDFTDATNFDIDIFRNKLEKAIFDRFEAVALLRSLGIELVG